MMRDVNARLAALAAEVQRRREIVEGPIDSLSQSILEFQTTMGELDELGKAALLGELNRGEEALGLTSADLDRFISDHKTDHWKAITRF